MIHRNNAGKQKAIESRARKETDDGCVSRNDKHDTESIPRGIPRTLRELSWG